MRSCLSVLLLISAVLHAAPDVHFVDTQGRAIHGLNPVARKLEGFFQEAVPRVIVIERKFFPYANSRFNCDTNTIFINTTVGDSAKYRQIVGHEASHLAMCRLTNQFNLREGSRFWDEGFATLIEYQVAENAYEPSAHRL